MTQKLETLTIHAGCEPDPTTKARITPIYQTASYVFDDVDHAAALFNLSVFSLVISAVAVIACSWTVCRARTRRASRM